jgi:hypothetical protein
MFARDTLRGRTLSTHFTPFRSAFGPAGISPKPQTNCPGVLPEILNIES